MISLFEKSAISIPTVLWLRWWRMRVKNNKVNQFFLGKGNVYSTRQCPYRNWEEEKKISKNWRSPHKVRETNTKKKKENQEYYLDIAEPIGKVIEPFEFALTLTITVPSTNGANPGKNLFK